MPWVGGGRGPARWEDPEPWEGRTCAECRKSCQAYEAGRGVVGPWLCLADAMEQPQGQACAVVIRPGDAACEGFDD